LIKKVGLGVVLTIKRSTRKGREARAMPLVGTSSGVRH